MFWTVHARWFQSKEIKICSHSFPRNPRTSKTTGKRRKYTRRSRISRIKKNSLSSKIQILRIIDQLEAVGIVGPFEGSKAREVRVGNEMALEQFLKDVYAREQE